MLNKVTSTMVAGDGPQGAGEQVNLNELDAQMEQIKDMFVKKQEMMKKMSTTTAPEGLAAWTSYQSLKNYSLSSVAISNFSW